jgi:hypothetical protein
VVSDVYVDHDAVEGAESGHDDAIITEDRALDADAPDRATRRGGYSTTRAWHDTSAEQRRPDLFGGFALHRRGHVAVEVHEQRRVRMAEAFSRAVSLAPGAQNRQWIYILTCSSTVEAKVEAKASKPRTS